MREEHRSEIIHDALNFLDDDLIEEVDDLRGGVIETPQKTVHPWRKWVTVAASVSVIVLAGSWLNGSFSESVIFDSGDASSNDGFSHPESGGIHPEMDNKEEELEDIEDETLEDEKVETTEDSEFEE